jgi:hypothetical protein
MLAFFFRDVNLSCDEFVGKAKADPQWAQEFILEYMLRMKQKVTKRKMGGESPLLRDRFQPLKTGSYTGIVPIL